MKFGTVEIYMEECSKKIKKKGFKKLLCTEGHW